MKTTLLMVVRILVVAYLGYLGLLFIVQRRIAFPGTLRVSPRAEPVAPRGVSQVWLETGFGRVEAWYLTAVAESFHDAPAPLNAAVIFSHGNGELIEDWEVAMRPLAVAGVAVLLLEFPGYGHSDGKPSRRTIREASVVALSHRREIDPDRIVAWVGRWGVAQPGIS